MATKNDNTLGGRVFFKLVPETQYTEGKRLALYNRIKAELPDFDTYDESAIYELSLIVSCTDTIEFTFNGHERMPLINFRAYWLDVPTQSAFDLVNGWLHLPSTIIKAWRREWNDAQEMFDVDPAELPSSMLTPAQKKEAEDPTSPLP